MTASLPMLIERLAREKGADLPPNWANGAETSASLGNEDGLATLTEQAGWKAPRRITGRPRANRFPLLAYSPEQGWLLAEQWEGQGRLRV